jgi:hypothetical protein
MTRPNLVLHLGLHKTATKFLQETFFPNLPGCRYVPKHFYERSFLDMFLNSDWSTFQANCPTMRSAFEQIFASLPGNGPIVISNELLSGNPFYRYHNRHLCLLKLREIFPGSVRIILSIRGQATMIDSLYREYIVQGGTREITDFVSGRIPQGCSILGCEPGLDPESLLYSRYLDSIADRFGQENLHVFPYERLAKYPDRVIETLCRFLELNAEVREISTEKRHGSIGNASLKILRLCNRFCSSAFHPGGLIPHRRNPGHLLIRWNLGGLNRAKAQPFLEHTPVSYAADNDAIDRKYGLNLRTDHPESYFLNAP